MTVLREAVKAVINNVNGKAIRIECEGSQCPPATSLPQGFGVCPMCGRMVATTEGRMKRHQRNDVLAMIERGDYG